MKNGVKPIMIKKDILYILEWSISVGSIITLLIILSFIYIFGGVICREPNQTILISEIILMIIGIILNIKRLRFGEK